MVLVAGVALDRFLFKVNDPLTGNTVYLGNYACALPGSSTLKENGIKYVLTLMCFGEAEEALRDNVSALQQLYAQRKTVVAEDGVTYHLVEMPDVTAPSRLSDKEKFVLEEATCFIDAALSRGKGSHVLVHCHKGEKRSPTILLAWMGTRNIRLMDAIESIDQGYRGKEGWASVYKKTRKDWIEELKAWNRNWTERQKRWSEVVRVSRQPAVEAKDTIVAVQSVACETSPVKDIPNE